MRAVRSEHGEGAHRRLHLTGGNTGRRGSQGGRAWPTRSVRGSGISLRTVLRCVLTISSHTIPEKQAHYTLTHEAWKIK